MNSNFCYNQISNLISQPNEKGEKEQCVAFWPLFLLSWRVLSAARFHLNLICAIIRFRFSCRRRFVCLEGVCARARGSGGPKGIRRVKCSTPEMQEVYGLVSPADLMRPIRYAVATAYGSPFTTLWMYKIVAMYFVHYI